MIDPVQGRLLIELKSAYKHIDPTDERFGTSKTRGVVLAIAPDIAEDCKKLNISVGDWVYFGKYEDTAPYDVEGHEKCSLIKLEEIGGRSEPDGSTA